jgi:hypothetical protein
MGSKEWFADNVAKSDKWTTRRGYHMYVAPEITEIGTVRDLTLAATAGHQLDADFARGTDLDDLTLS